MNRFARRSLLIAALALAPFAQAHAETDTATLQALREGGVAVLWRHAQTTPGVGDPPGFVLAQCKTQRNLSAEGRAQARRFGQWMAKQQLRASTVRNSRWCRARETAELAFARHQDWTALDNLFDDSSGRERQVAQAHQYLATLKSGELAVLVSHGVTISAIAGSVPAQGEALVVRATRGTGGELQLQTVGRINVP
jgi:phosphohistidine phosphatase SixA